jgi:predicted ArsR family transcriptional regulator
MQTTRQYILEILREHSELTVGEIVAALRQDHQLEITAVTVRHHLSVLRDNGLVDTPQMRHRDAPGRPCYVYALTQKAATLFPNNYQRLATGLLAQIKHVLPQQQVNVILEGVAEEMAQDAHITAEPMPQRLTQVVEHLTQHGYEARWEQTEGGYLLHTCNCPYHGLVHTDKALCQMDMHMVTRLLQVVPRMTARISEGDNACSYFIPEQP